MRKQIQTEHQRRLPHFHHPAATFFVTTHLEGSIPFDVLRKLKEEREEKIQGILRKNEPEKDKLIYLAHREHYLQYDDLLDKCENSPTYLQDPVVAQIVKDALFDYDGKLYNLIAFTLMPNHLHALLDFSVQMPDSQQVDLDVYANLDKAMNLVKGRSARYANLYLNRTGSKFWGDEYHDRYIRNYQHFIKAVDYIKNNPVKAKICLHWLHHLHTWVRPDYLEMNLLYPRFKK